MELEKSRILQNANIVAFVVWRWPELKLNEVILKLNMPGVSINTAIWYAVERGFIKEPDPETGIVEVGPNVPTIHEWDFGPEISNLSTMITYSFQQLAKKQGDLEEVPFNSWVMGYSELVRDVAREYLMARKVLAEYAIEDGDSTYTFYTLYENRDKQWGRVQFKEDPLLESETGQPGPEVENNQPAEDK